MPRWLEIVSNKHVLSKGHAGWFRKMPGTFLALGIANFHFASQGLFHVAVFIEILIE
jgi:hypothetical protein